MTAAKAILKLGADEKFHLPLEVVTLATAILAQRGAGKSHTASCLAEEMLDAGQQIVAIDPTGAWFGLKSSVDGNRAGYAVVIFGGDHADVPLEEHAGEIIARAIVEKGYSAILDLSLFRKGAMRRFMADFLETLYRLNRNPLHVFVDEADALAPQRPGPDEARMLGAMEDMVRRGRRRGLGCTLITQRPQVLNKNVLTQCELLIAMRLGHPKDINAIEEWAAVHADMLNLNAMVQSLPGLPTGTAWFWSPVLELFQKVKIRARRTFDSGATPKPGQVLRTPKAAAEIDIEKLGQEIAATVADAKANDPKTLKAEILRLKAASDKAAVKETEKIVEVMPDRLLKLLNQFSDANAGAQKLLAEVTVETLRHPKSETLAARPVKHSAVIPYQLPRRMNSALNGGSGESMGRCERALLTVLAQYPQGRRRSQMAILSGYSVASGGFANSLSKANSSGWRVTEGDLRKITSVGLTALGDYDPLPTGAELLQKWLNDLGKCEAAILRALADVYPRGLSRSATADVSGYSETSGGYANALSRLRTLELISGSHELTASPDLF